MDLGDDLCSIWSNNTIDWGPGKVNTIPPKASVSLDPKGLVARDDLLKALEERDHIAREYKECLRRLEEAEVKLKEAEIKLGVAEVKLANSVYVFKVMAPKGVEVKPGEIEERRGELGKKTAKLQRMIPSLF